LTTTHDTRATADAPHVGAKRRLRTGIPVWVRVPGIIALILVGVLIGTMLLGAAGAGDVRGRSGGHGGSGGAMEMRDYNGGGSGGQTETRDHKAGQGAGHGAGANGQMRDHKGGQTGLQDR
jgi:hypothetical protein